MRIDVVNRVYGTYQAQVTTASKKTDKVESRDEVDLSSEAKDFASIKKMLSDVPEVRQDKVQDIKERMDNGTYNVSAGEVAQRMLSRYSTRG